MQTFIFFLIAVLCGIVISNGDSIHLLVKLRGVEKAEMNKGMIQI